MFLVSRARTRGCRCLLANQDAAELHITFSKPANNADDVNQEFVRLRREAAFPQ